jgi:hypothetical protein
MASGMQKSAIDISSLVTGHLALIFFSIACVQLGKLHQLSKKQAASALRGWPAQPPFFSSATNNSKSKH